jgi:hypothetical protein
MDLNANKYWNDHKKQSREIEILYCNSEPHVRDISLSGRESWEQRERENKERD